MKEEGYQDNLRKDELLGIEPSVKIAIEQRILCK
jgi:hypothetical protein